MISSILVSHYYKILSVDRRSLTVILNYFNRTLSSDTYILNTERNLWTPTALLNVTLLVALNNKMCIFPLIVDMSPYLTYTGSATLGVDVSMLDVGQLYLIQYSKFKKLN